MDVAWRRAAAYVVCRDEPDRLLLTRFVSPGHPDSGMWTLPGGGLDWGESAEAAQPAKRAFHHRASGQQHNPPFGFVMLDDLQFDRRLTRLFGRWLAGVTLINRRDPHAPARDCLNLFRKPGDMGAIVEWRPRP